MDFMTDVLLNEMPITKSDNLQFVKTLFFIHF